MSIATWYFSENTPAAPTSGTAALSVNPVSGASQLQYANGVLSAVDLDNAASLAFVGKFPQAVGGTYQVVVQTSLDEGNSWQDLASFPVITTSGGTVQYTGTVSQGYPTAFVASGSGTAPALSAGAVINSAWGNKLRLAIVANAGTSAGVGISVEVSAKQMATRRNG